MPTTPRSDQRGPRGRPFRHATTGGPFETPTRVAWLLRVNRLLGEDPEWTHAATFAGAFRGRAFPRGISESTVSRWETGTAGHTFAAIRRYEELLRLPHGQLTAVADTIGRYAASTHPLEPVLRRGPPPEPGSAAFATMEELLDRAVSGAAMVGTDWDELTGLVSTIPRLVLVPSRMWTDVAGRLLEETVVSDGLPWMLRFEGLNRLLAHPIAAPAAVGACVNMVRDPTNQVFIEPVSLLDGSAHPDASRFVLGQLIRPINERSRYGALLACVRKVRYGHLNVDQLGTIIAAVSGLLGESDASHGASALGIELIRRLPPSVRAEAAPGLRRVLTHDRTLTAVLSGGRLASAATAAVVVNRIVGAAEAALASRAPTFTDDLLGVLVDEMLYAPVLDVRLYAAMLMRATPYGPALAAALAAELARPQVIADPTLATSVLWGLRVLGDAAQRPLVERLVLAAGVLPEVAEAAVHSLAHVGGGSADRFWLTAMALHARAWRRHRTTHSATALTGLVYGVGIAGNRRLLRHMRDHPDVPEPVRASAVWWLARPTLPDGRATTLASTGADYALAGNPDRSGSGPLM